MVNVSVLQDTQVIDAPVTFGSRLSAWCDKVIEMGWLAAIIVVPLFFNIYSSRVFEPDKLTTLRSIAIVMALAWLVKWFEERGNPLRDQKISWRTPLVIPTLILVVFYLISSALSVAPRTSLLGSYQRLQGTYTTLSYIVVFFMILQGLRNRAQIERLLTVMVITSLPVAAYGLLQRMKLDPLPWGGDTFERVASNMGNSIFVAAYLIMTFYIAVYKTIESILSIVRSPRVRITDVGRAAAYLIIILMNLIVVLQLAGSRGPQLGFFAGVFFMLMLMVQLIRSRKVRLGVTLGVIGLGLAGLSFFVWLNVAKDNPTAIQLRESVPLFRRMSSVLTTSEGTNSVRVLIWEGAANLVAPHAPIQKPDGSLDAWNTIRPLVGYGPESMYVAYNRFYPPALANIEARNASPDRSHNETWDSLVITGIFGFIAYMLLFGSVLYYGFRWIGLIAKPLESVLFIACWILGGGAAGTYFVSIGSPNLLGIGIAGGIGLGLAVFLIVSAVINALRKEGEEVKSSLTLRDQMLLIAIISTVVAHFVEIHTGIAIASTRTHFWVLIALMVVVGAGYLYGKAEQAAPEPVLAPANEAVAATATAATQPASAATGGGTRRQRRAAQTAGGSGARVRRSSGSGRSSLPAWARQAIGAGVLMGLILGVLAFNFTNNLARETNAGDVFWNSLTMLPITAGLREAATPSLGVLSLFLGTLLLGSIIFVGEMHARGALEDNNANVLPALALISAIGLFSWVLFGTFVAGRLVAFISSGKNTIQNVLDVAMQIASFPVYVYMLVIVAMAVGAYALRREHGSPQRGLNGIGGMLVGLLGFPIALVLIVYSNLQPIQADIVYKQAGNWDQQASRPLVQGQTALQGWDLAIEHHRLAIRLAPNEDFYYLWLGRALLEKARTHPNPAQTSIKIGEEDSFAKIIDDNANEWGKINELDPVPLPSAKLSQQDLLNSAKIILEEARRINPLNTDHSANLGRMWLQTVDVVQNSDDKARRFGKAIESYTSATSLSPNNAQLFNEWANLHMKRKEYALAQEKLDQSLSIDKKFDATRLLRASLFLQQAEPLAVERAQAQQIITTATPTATKEIDAAKATLAKVDGPWRGFLERAVPELEAAAAINPGNLQTHAQLVLIKQQMGDLTPEAAQELNVSLNAVQAAGQNWTVWRALADGWSKNKQPAMARAAMKQALAVATPAEKAAVEPLLKALGE